MKSVKAIVYTSGTGHTRQYAELLGSRLNLPALQLKEATEQVGAGEAIVYMGWLMAGHIKGLDKAVRRWQVRAACGVGLRSGAEQLAEIRQANPVPEGAALFALQGGYAPRQLRGLNKWMMSMVAGKLVRDLSAKCDRTAQEQDLLDLLTRGGSRVDEQSLDEVAAFVGQG